jgi:hypothetical protein
MDNRLEVSESYLEAVVKRAATQLVGELLANIETVSNLDELKKTAKNTVYQNFRDLSAQIKAFDSGVKFTRPPSVR